MKYVCSVRNWGKGEHKKIIPHGTDFLGPATEQTRIGEFLTPPKGESTEHDLKSLFAAGPPKKNLF